MKSQSSIPRSKASPQPNDQLIYFNLQQLSKHLFPSNYEQSPTQTHNKQLIATQQNYKCISALIQNHLNLIHNINILAMENIIKKTNLGIAVQQAISQLGLERQRTKIMTYLQKSFQQKFQEFKKTLTSTNGTLRGYYVADNEFPIGEHDKQQYFRSIAFQAKIGGVSLTATSNVEKKPFTLIEGYSRNDDSKKRQYSKAHTKSEKKNSETSGKKKPKK